MATVSQLSATHWVVHLGRQADSNVTVELRMSEDQARDLANLETNRIAELNPTEPQPAENVGSAVLTLLASVLAIGRVKERLRTADQQEIMNLIDDEVAAERASRP
ncbi:MAG: hypothetical protein OYL92_10535 [Acidobacteriota bacterium]|nr:hypothetical protein [Acidobacteriota bacterium]MDE3265394.1 hypothetical protein [Acidobacteriota bacterium]